MLSIALLSTSKLIQLLRLACMIWLSLIVLKQLAPYIEKHEQYTYITQAISFEKTVSKPLNAEINKYLPTIINNRNITPIYKLIILLLLLSNLKFLYWKTSYYGRYLKQKGQLRKLQGDKFIAKDNEMYKKLETQFDSIEKCKDQKQSFALLENFIDLKNQISSKSKDVAFLSVDIVDSTGIKASEDKANVQFDFLKYKKMLQEIFDKNQCLKTAWTPDGVMICFQDVNQAVDSTKSLLDELTHFNKNIKSIKRDFVVRCGINSGVVYYDDDIPLEEMTDQVIDVAGHMQKYADHGSLYMAKPAYEQLKNKKGFKEIAEEVDGFGVYQYSPA